MVRNTSKKASGKKAESSTQRSQAVAPEMSGSDAELSELVFDYYEVTATSESAIKLALAKAKVIADRVSDRTVPGTFGKDIYTDPDGTVWLTVQYDQYLDDNG